MKRGGFIDRASHVDPNVSVLSVGASTMSMSGAHCSDDLGKLVTMLFTVEES